MYFDVEWMEKYTKKKQRNNYKIVLPIKDGK